MLSDRLGNYLLSIGFVLTALLLRITLGPFLLLDVPFITFFVAIVAAVWNGGVGPGFLAMALSGILAEYFFIPPRGSLLINVEHLTTLGLFGLEAAGLIYLTETLQRRTKQVRSSESRAHEHLRALQIIYDTSPVGMCQLDRNFRCVRINNRLAKMNGIPVADHFGKTLRDIVPVAADIFETFCSRVLETGESVTDREVTGESRTEPGTQHTWLVSWYPQRSDAGEVIGVNVLAQDITNVKQTERALRESEEQLQRFAAQLEQQVDERTKELIQSQEQLRALATELNLAEQRERKRLAAELHDHLQQILVLGKFTIGYTKRSAIDVAAYENVLNKLDGLLSDALAYTQTLVADLSPPVLRDHGLAAGLEWLGEFMRKHDLIVTVTVPKDHLLKLSDDQTVLLFQSVRELLINVSKHAGTNEVTVELAENAGCLEVIVRDEGEGFDLAAAELSASNARTGVSSKFGLFSIRERMNAIGGWFNIQSQVGQGTTATLTLPLKATQKASLDLPKDVLVTHVGDQQMKQIIGGEKFIRILVVDDHAMVRQGLRAILETYADVQVVGEACDGIEALTAVDRLQPQVILLDINMPNKNGIEATAEIIARYPDIRIIGLSVNAGHENQQAMLKAGASMLLTKEAAVEQLYRAVQEVTKPRCETPAHGFRV